MKLTRRDLGLAGMALLPALFAGCGGGSGGSGNSGTRVQAGQYTGSWSLFGGASGTSGTYGSMTASVDSSGNLSGAFTQTSGYYTGSTFTCTGTVDASGNTNITFTGGPGDTGKGTLGLRSNGHYTGTLTIYSGGQQVNLMSVDLTFVSS